MGAHAQRLLDALPAVAAVLAGVRRRDRTHSFTFPKVGAHGGARLEHGVRVVSKLGRIAVRWRRPIGGYTHDGDPLARGRWLVRLPLVHRGAQAGVARDGTGDGH
jgi:hypothetical protein